MVAFGNIAAINAVSSIPPLKREWAKGSDAQAQRLTGAFAFAGLAITVHSGGVSGVIKEAGFKGGLGKYGKSAATLVASSLDLDDKQSLALFGEFDVQSAFDVANNSMALPILVYFHAYCSLRDLDVAGYWPGNEGQRLPLKDGLLPLPEPGLVQIVTRAATHGLSLDRFLPHNESAVIVPRMVELMSVCLTEARRQLA
jgi:hypothetical protein